MSITLRNSAFALALLGSAALLATPSFAVEPDVDSPAGPELPANRDHPDYAPDDQTGAPLERDIKGFWIARGPDKKCVVVETEPMATETTVTRVGKDVYVTRDEAESDLAVVCQ